MRKLFIAPFAMFVLSIPIGVTAQIPRTLSYQGVLTEASTGKPRADGAYEFTFRLYDVASGGTSIWEEQSSLQVTNGLFSIAMGETTPFDANVKFDRQYWLGIQVGSEPELSPRIALTSVGYSMSSLRADTAMVAVAALADSTWKHDGENIYRLTGKIGIGTNNPTTKLHINGQSLWLTGGNGMTFPVGGGGAGLRMYYDEANKWGMIFAWDYNNSVPLNMSFQEPGGNVGIGTLPDVKFHVVGNRLRVQQPGSTKLLDIRADADEMMITTFENPMVIGSNSSVLLQPYVGHGNVGIGTTNPTAKLEVVGRTKTNVLEIIGGMDLAEPIPISESESLPPGAIVVIDEDSPGHLKLSRKPYDKGVAGIVSGAGGINPGLTLRQEGVMEGEQNIALTGRVYALATAVNGPIKPGDRLTTSAVPGHCMKATDSSLCDGAVIGKAMSSLETGEGLVLVLVNLQ